MLYSRGECRQWHRDEWKKKHFALWISPSAYSQHPPLRGRAGSSSNSCSVSSELWAQPSCDPWLLWKVCCGLFAPTGALYIVLCYCRSSVENLFSSSIFTQSIHFPSHWQRLLCVDIWAEIRALAEHTYPFRLLWWGWNGMVLGPCFATHPHNNLRAHKTTPSCCCWRWFWIWV